MTKFVLIGAGGFIAPRHLAAIKDTHNLLACAMDKNDSVGVLDSYFPKAEFVTSEIDLENFISSAQERPDTAIDYLVVCTPNHLHKAHIDMGIRHGLKVICEKPLVVDIEDLKKLLPHKDDVFSILQLRLHPQLIELKEKIDQDTSHKMYEVDLNYITSRGKWYHKSWKGNEHQSGGLVSNIGVHFFDMLIWIFGAVKNQRVNLLEQCRASGQIELERASVKWFLSVDEKDLPIEAIKLDKRTYRSITVDGEEIEFSDGFADLHKKSYEEILAGRGFSIDTALPSIQLLNQIRKSSEG